MMPSKQPSSATATTTRTASVGDLLPSTSWCRRVPQVLAVTLFASTLLLCLLASTLCAGTVGVLLWWMLSGSEDTDGVGVRGVAATGLVFIVPAVAWYLRRVFVTDAKRSTQRARNRSRNLPRWWWYRTIRAYFAPAIYFAGLPAEHKFQPVGDVSHPDCPAAVRDALYASFRNDPSASYLAGAHPHGVVGIGVWCSWVFDNPAVQSLFRARGFDVTVHTLRMNFFIPFWRELVLDNGFSDVARDTLVRCLTPSTSAGPAAAAAHHGKAREVDTTIAGVSGSAGCDGGNRPGLSVLVPGGALESLYCTEPRLALHRRLGFVRVALETRASLVPTYTFGETGLYGAFPGTTHPSVHPWLVQLQKVLGFAPPFVIGRSALNFFTPRRKRMQTVVGAPIDTRQFLRSNIRKGDEVTEEEVRAAHRAYRLALEQLYREYQPRLDPSGPRELRYIDGPIGGAGPSKKPEAAAT